MKLSSKTISNQILCLAWLAYIFSYLGRVNYNASMLEIINETGLSRSLAGMVSSSFFLCYAAGQAGSALLLRRFPPLHIVFAELLTAAAVNLLFPLAGSLPVMLLLWGINGCVQSTLLCALTQIFVDNLQEPYLSRSAVLVNTVGSVGGVLNYLITWALLRAGSWHSVFWVSGGILLVFAAVWIGIMPRIASSSSVRPVPGTAPAENKTPSDGVPPVPGLWGVLVALFGSFSVGLLREGVSLWIPTYINDTFPLSILQSTIVTVFVPLFQLFGAVLAGLAGRKTGNLHRPAAWAFFFSGLSLLLLWHGVPGLTATILLFVINSVSSTAALTIYISMFPLRSQPPERTAMFVGISNFFCHIGSLAASSGIGWLSGKAGWQTTLGFLAALAVFSSLLSVTGAKGSPHRRR